MTTLPAVPDAISRTLLPALLVAIAGCQGEGQGLAARSVGADTRLASAMPVGDLAPEPADHITVRRLWTGSYRDFAFSSISPDGRYMSLVDWSTIDLAVRDLGTGKLHRLTNAERGEGKPYEDAGSSVFSPDGQQLVYVWQYAPLVQLRTMDLESDTAGSLRPADPTVLFSNPEFEPYFPFDWSPDGSRILAKAWVSGGVNHDHNTNQLALISTADGTYRALRSFDWREPLSAEFSPDGRYVAYDFLPELDSPNRDLFVVSLDGTFEARIVDGPAIDRLLGWHPGGSILFHSDRGGTPGIWRVQVREGRATGPPELLKADLWGVEPLGFSQGRFYYGVDVSPPRLYTSTLDHAEGRLTSVPEAVGDPAQLTILGWDWSPDGDFLAYSATTPGAAGSVLGLRSASGEDVRAVRLELNATRRIRWDPDGRSIIMSTTDSRGRRGFFRVDLESGSSEAALFIDELEESTADGDFAISPDGGTLYFGALGGEPESDYWLQLVSHDLESDSTTRIGTVGWPGLVAVDPAGTRLAVVTGSAEPGGPAGPLTVVGTQSVEGGPVTALYEVPHELNVTDLTWTPDGSSVLIVTARSGPAGLDAATLLSVSADGGAVREIEFADDLRPWLKLHPDGRQIAYMAGASRGEVWVMEGLSSAAGGEDER